MRRRELLGALVATGVVGCRRAVAPAAIPPAAGDDDMPSPAIGDDADATADGTPPAADFAELHGFCDGVAPVGAAEQAEHRTRMAAAMRDAGIGALVVEPGATMAYLTGVRWGRSERPFLLVLPARGDPRFVVPAFEARRAAEQVGEIAVATWQEHGDPFGEVAAALRSTRGRIALDPQIRSFIAEGVRAKVGRRRPVVVDDPAVAAVRMRKTDAELSRLRRVNEATKAALAAAAKVIGPGMKQSQIAATIRAAQRAAGLDDIWVLALAGPAAAFPHGTHEDRELVAGELLLVDTGGSLHGYRSDITRTWATGPVDARFSEAWETVRRAQAAGLAAIRPGAVAGDVDAAARAVIAEAGFGDGYERFTHRLGHGIGLEVHEPPYLLPQSQLVLESGMTMSNEPGIYEPGAFGIRIEDIVAVTDDGAEVFGPTVGGFDRPFG